MTLFELEKDHRRHLTLVMEQRVPQDGEEYLTSRVAAELWTARAREMGFLHYYHADSVRQAEKQGRIKKEQTTRVGRNILYARRDMQSIDIRPWMRLDRQVPNDQRTHPCARCGKPTPAHLLQWRTWYWCEVCRTELPQQWADYHRSHMREESRMKSTICREAFRRGEVA